MKTSAEAKPACKITMQYRRGRERVYEIESSGNSVDLYISKPEALETEWQVSAHSGRSADAVIISESAPTGAEALQKVGRAWVAKPSGLSPIDWQAVAEVLVAVRGL